MSIHCFRLRFIGILLLLSFRSVGQGCSDAGFCTAGALQFNQKIYDTLPANTLGMSVTAGLGEQNVFILIPQLEWKHSFNKVLDLEMKLPYYYSNGALGSFSGPGDPVATITRKWKGTQTWHFFTTAGVRISWVTAAKANQDGRPLPMPYQNGLGTTDLILGASAQYSDWLFFSGGYQQPIVQYNENGYLASAFPQESVAYRSYFDSRQLIRRGDILLRCEGRINWPHVALSGGPLFVYHLGSDLAREMNGQEYQLMGSSGATLNLAAKLSWQKRYAKWELSSGAPLIVRDARPDGLTRSFVLTLRYERYL